MIIDKRLPWMSLALLILVALPAAAEDPPAPAAAGAGIPLPISTAWIYMADDKNYNRIPTYWYQVDFTAVDVLNVGPAGIQADGTFGLYKSAKTGDLANRFKWILERARAQNPRIKIIVSQWWGSRGAETWGRPLSAIAKDPAAIEKYARSVHDFLAAYRTTAGGVDGYDIDYEDDNITPATAAITQQVRAQLTRLSNESGGRPFYLTVSPSAADPNLKLARDFIDLVNMQTYAGGWGLAPDAFTALGFKSTQLLYGICPETRCGTPSFDDVKKAFRDNRLAGIHLWRLNSDNYKVEGSVQRQVYDFLHGAPAAAAP